MLALGFDPGTATTGYGVVALEGSRLRYVAHGTIDTPAHTHFATRLQHIHEEAGRLLVRYRPDAVAIEKIYFKQNVTTGIAVAQARGVLALSVAEAGLPLGEFAPAEVKAAVVGFGRAEKRQVQLMIQRLLALDALPRPDDAADGLGLAICLLHAGLPSATTGQ